MMAYKRLLKSSVLLLASIPLVAQADWPVANSDSAEATTAQSISIPVLQNDTGDGLVLTTVDTTSKKGGEVSINADKQTVTYQSADGFEGTDSFWYDFKDAQGRTNAAKVTVVVTADSDGGDDTWPVANPDSIEATTEQSISIPVLQNDTGNGLVLTTVDTTSKKGGEVSINADKQTVTYQSADGFEGTDSFWYDFKDDQGRTNATKVTVVVKADGGPNDGDGPVAVADHFTAISGRYTTYVDLLANDKGESIGIASLDALSENSARVEVGMNARIGYEHVSYRVRPDFSGEDSFSYTIKDANGRTSTAKVTVTVLPENTPTPVVYEDTITTPKDRPVRINVLKNDLFKVHNRGRISGFQETSANGGTIEKIIPYPDVPPKHEQLIYTPPAGFSGTDSFEYTAKDIRTGDTATSLVTVEVAESSEFTTPYPIARPDIKVLGCCEVMVFPLKNDSGEDLIVKLDSAWSLRGAKVFLWWSNTFFGPVMDYDASAGYVQSGGDTVYYLIEDRYGRQNWSKITLTQ